MIVRGGSADVSTPQGSTHVDAGQMITVAGTDNPQYKTAAAPGRDDWDSWNNDRNRTSNPLRAGTTRIATTLVRRIWIPMASGPKFPITAQCGFPSRDLIGLPIATAAGFTNRITAGRGFPTSPGVGRRITMAVGSSTAAVGLGGPDPFRRSLVLSGLVAGLCLLLWVRRWLGSWRWIRIWWLRSWLAALRPGRLVSPVVWTMGRPVQRRRFSQVHDHHRGGFRPLAGQGFRGRQFSNLDMALRNDRVRGGISSMQGDRFGRAAVSPHQERISSASFQRASLMTGKMPVSPARDSFSPSGRAANPASFRNAPSASQHFFNGGARANAGISSRQSSSFANSRAGSSFGGGRNASVQSSRPGWRTFSPPSGSSNTRAPAMNSARGNFGQSESRGSNQSRPSLGAENQNRGSWQHFTPPSHQSQAQGQAYGRGYAQSNGSERGYRPSEQTYRGGYSNSDSRPPLNMRQPIVTPRSNRISRRILWRPQLQCPARWLFRWIQRAAPKLQRAPR